MWTHGLVNAYRLLRSTVAKLSALPSTQWIPSLAPASAHLQSGNNARLQGSSTHQHVSAHKTSPHHNSHHLFPVSWTAGWVGLPTMRIVSAFLRRSVASAVLQVRSLTSRSVNAGALIFWSKSALPLPASISLLVSARPLASSADWAVLLAKSSTPQSAAASAR